MGSEGKAAYQKDRIFMKETDSFRFFLREVLVRGSCRISARLARQRKLSYAKGRAAYFLEGHFAAARGGYRYHNQGDPAWKDRVAGIYQLQALTARELAGYLDLFRALGDAPVPLVSLVSRRRSGVSEDSYRLYLRGLEEEGIALGLRRSGQACFQGNVDVFAGLTPAQQRQTASLLEWAVAAAPYSSFFSSLRRTFLLRYPGARPLAPTRYRHLQAHPILDELFYWPVQEALRDRRLVRVHYIRDGEPEPLTLVPLGSVFDLLYGRSYLCCCREEGGPPLTLRYDRIRKLEVLRRGFSPEDPPLAEALRRYREDLPLAWNISLGPERHLVRLRFRDTPGVRYRAANEGRHGAILEDGEEGFFLYQVTVTDWLELKSWVLSFGDCCEVLSPRPLREEIAAACRELVFLLEGGEGHGYPA